MVVLYFVVVADFSLAMVVALTMMAVTPTPDLLLEN
jgi:hypothetical protein